MEVASLDEVVALLSLDAGPIGGVEAATGGELEAALSLAGAVTTMTVRVVVEVRPEWPVTT